MRKIKKKFIFIGIFVVVLFLVIITIAILKNNKKQEENVSGTIEEDEKIEIISTYDNPIVPEGFSKVETDSASWKLENGVPKGWNNGLVIEDEIGNQFVWVPVKDINSKLNFKYTQYEEVEQDEQQIIKYGGFYIARYEAGIPKDITYNKNELDIQGIPVSKKNVIGWDFITLKNALSSAQKMYEGNEYIQSSLITVKQWAYIMQWLNNTGYDINDSKYGNFVDTILRFTGYYSTDFGESFQYATDSQKGFEVMLLSTGASEKCKTNNIYDLAGNLIEFTNSFNNTRGYYSVGGHFCELGDENWSSPSLIGDKTPLEKLGFRVMLYNK